MVENLLEKGERKNEKRNESKERERRREWGGNLVTGRSALRGRGSRRLAAGAWRRPAEKRATGCLIIAPICVSPTRAPSHPIPAPTILNHLLDSFRDDEMKMLCRCCSHQISDPSLHRRCASKTVLAYSACSVIHADLRCREPHPPGSRGPQIPLGLATTAPVVIFQYPFILLLYRPFPLLCTLLFCSFQSPNYPIILTNRAHYRGLATTTYTLHHYPTFSSTYVHIT